MNSNKCLTTTTMLWQNRPDYFGISCLINEDLPEEADLVQTYKLMGLLKSYGVFEDDSELQHREIVMKRLESLFKEWLKEICVEMNVPESVTDKVGGKVLPFGSYSLGAHSKGADIDVLCVGPGFIERKEFFTSFCKKLKAQQEVKDIQAIEEAFVPVIKLTYDGIEIDMVFARIARKSISERINLLEDQWLQDIDKQCVRSLNGYRVTEEILRLVPNVANFRLALSVIKHWAKCHNIYSNKLGFLGGVSWSILMARVCQVYPNATVSTLVIKFFKLYSMWNWPIPIRLRVMEDRHYKLPFWDPRFNVADRYHHMPIITPAYPQQNTAYNVSPSTYSIITAEIERGHIIAQEIQQGKADWSKLFDAPDFFEKFQHYVLLRVSSATEEQHTQWSGLVESKLRHLVGILETNPNVKLAHIHTQPFHERRTDINKDGVSTLWLIGLLIPSDPNRIEKQKVDLSFDLFLFTDTMYFKAKDLKIYEEGMTISAIYSPRENLSWKMSNGERKRFSTPKPKPEVSHQTPATVQCHHAQPAIMGQANRKRKDLLQPERSAKRIKTDKESVSMTNEFTCITPTLPARISQATTRACPPNPETSSELKCDDNKELLCPPSKSPNLRRPSTPELEEPAKKFKPDLTEPDPDELSEELPAPTKPVTTVKHTIKLSLLRRN